LVLSRWIVDPRMPANALSKRNVAIGAAARLLLAAFACLPAFLCAHASDAIVVNADRYRVETGRYSPFAVFQGNLQRILDDCGKGTPHVVAPGEVPHGRIGTETRLGVQRALSCAPLHEVPADSPARTGAITEAVWRVVMPDVPVPSFRQRTEALVLSFEATDFGEKPEWNFCQDSRSKSSGEFDPRAPGAVCYNESDPCSFLTWGPRGATAGQGREIQWILWLAWKRSPAEVERAFAGEFANVARFFKLKGNPQNTCKHGAPVELFMCSVWLDSNRRKVWENALVELGRKAIVRDSYAHVFALEEFDGAKLQAFFAQWQRLGLSVTEVDYAFFMDRITHQGGPTDDDGGDPVGLRACIAVEHLALSRNGAARRCLARLQPHSTQPESRLARDVAFYLDAYPEGALSKKEIKAWAEYVPLSADYNFALSDATAVQLDPAPSLLSLDADLPLPSTSNLTKAELTACPHNILFPISRAPSR
jgi:hypothetical protein